MKIDGVIPANSEMRGNMSFAGGIWIDGKVIGDLTGQPQTATSLVVSTKGCVVGDIAADTVVVYGQVQGNIDARRIEVLASGRITGGRVSYADIQISQGALVNADMQHRVPVAQSEGEDSAVRGDKGGKTAGSTGR